MTELLQSIRILCRKAGRAALALLATREDGWRRLSVTIALSLLAVIVGMAAAFTVLPWIERLAGHPGPQTWQPVDSQWPTSVTEQTFIDLLASPKTGGLRHQPADATPSADLIVLLVTRAENRDGRTWLRGMWQSLLKRVASMHAASELRERKPSSSARDAARRPRRVWPIFACGSLDGAGKRSERLTADLLAEQRLHGDLLAVRSNDNQEGVLAFLALQLISSFEFEAALVLSDYVLPTFTYLSMPLTSSRHFSDVIEYNNDVIAPNFMTSKAGSTVSAISMSAAAVRGTVALAIRGVLSADDNRSAWTCAELLTSLSTHSVLTRPRAIAAVPHTGTCGRRSGGEARGQFFVSLEERSVKTFKRFEDLEGCLLTGHALESP